MAPPLQQMDYRALAALDAVAAQGSFEKAALALGVSQSAISQRIKALEDATGRLLVVRGTPSTPTGLGQRLVAHYRQVRMMEAALDIDLGRQATLPDLTIAADADSLATWLGEALPPLLSPPRCQLEVRAADGDTALTLVREGAVFGCVAPAEARAPDGFNGTTATPLGALRYRCVATPAFARHWFGDGFSAEAVALAPAVTDEARLLARFLAAELGVTSAFPHHTLPPPVDAIGAGVAYGLAPELAVRAALAQGTLLDLKPDAVLDVALVWHAWNIDTPFTHAVSEQVVATARRLLVG
ncbi:MAG: ArgP/LysG family DNA-binding transcriptional regulator [Telluria sp.]